MNNLTTFKLQIVKCALVCAAIFELGSLPLIGFDIKYLCGLLAGTCVSILSFYIMFYTSQKALASGIKWMVSLGYIVRLPLYGVVFYFCMKAGLFAGIACLIGFLTVMFAAVYIHGIKAKFSTGRKVRPEVMAEFEREDREKELRERGEADDIE